MFKRRRKAAVKSAETIEVVNGVAPLLLRPHHPFPQDEESGAETPPARESKGKQRAADPL